MTYRNIVLFSDGTGNSSGKLHRTNVWRTYEALDLKDPQRPPDPRQFAFYDNGVGTSSFKPLAILGGAIGLGLSRNVKDIYAYLCRTYRPADAAAGREADRIHAFGFSRGAFTIRVLTGLILTQGLVVYDGDEAKLARDVAAAWRQYRRERYRTRGGLVDVVRGVRDALIRRVNGLRGHLSYDEIARIGRPTRPGEPPDPADPPIDIAFLGLWDTVDAYGLPVDELTKGIDDYIWPLSMPNHDLNPGVRRAMHALALDDERNTFHPRLWNETPSDVIRPGDQPAAGPDGRWPDPSRISQVWFAGVHSNVGGGYPDDALSHVPLLWILRGAAEAGLRFEARILAEYEALSDENGPIYDPRRGLGSYYRYNPRRIANVLAKDRITVQSVKVHESVFRRIRAGLDGYAPLVLPPDFEVLRIDGQVVGGAAFLGQPGRQVLPVETEHVWNGVWWRRVAYFATLALTLGLATMPMWADTEPAGACRSPFCVLATPIGWAGALLPAFADPWVDVFRSAPGTFALLAGLVAGTLLWGSALSGAIADRMRLAWYRLDPMRPDGLSPAPVPPLGATDGAIERWRRSAPYHAFGDWAFERVLPAVFAASVVLAGLTLLSRVALSTAESVGLVCSADLPKSAEVNTARSCNATPFGVDKDGIYRLRLVTMSAWRDGPRPGRAPGLPATPNGLVAGAEPWYFRPAVPLRRHLGTPWFATMVRVGATGSDSHAPVWRRMDRPGADPAGSGPGETWEAIVTARSSGRLYVYVNDATFYPLFAPFYPSNKGRARLTVEPVVGSR